MLKFFRFLSALLFSVISLFLFYSAIRRAIPYSQSYPYAILGWLSLGLFVMMCRPLHSLKVFSYRVFLTLAWLSPTVILVSFLQSGWFGFGALSPQFFFSVALIFGIPLYIAIRKSSSENLQILRENLLHCVILLISVIATLGVLELSFRILGQKPYIPIKFSESFTRQSSIPGLLFELQPNHTWKMQYPTNPRDYFDDDNTITFKTNSSGFRDTEFELEKKSDRYRIALLGDSFGFGYGVRKEDGVADRIEVLLGRNIKKKVEVYNFSVVGYSTMEEAILLESTVLKYQPDLIIVWFYINDPKYLGRLEDIQSDLFKVFPVLRKHSSFFYFFGSRFDEIIPRKKTVEIFRALYQDGDKRWMNCEESLRKMGQLAAENGIPIYLFFHPVLYDLREEYPFSDIHQKVIETAEGFGIKAYDLLDAFKDKDEKTFWIHPQDMHPNEIAHEIAAEFVVGVLTEQEFEKGGAGR